MESSDENNIDVLNKRLDSLSVNIVKTMHNILKERQYLNGNLREGHIFLAKSRYLMRGQKISQMQINTSTPKASLKSFSFSDVVNDIEYVGFSVFKEVDTSVSTESSLKKRSTGVEDDLCGDMNKATISSDMIDGEESKENSKRDPTIDDSPAIDDPLRWFGVLVPQTLRISRDHFAQSAETAVKIATLQNELKALCATYRALRLEKKRIM